MAGRGKGRGVETFSGGGVSPLLSPRDRAARAVYRLRPFRTAMSTSPLDDMLTQSRVFDFDEAPAYYQADCYRIADAVLAVVSRSRAPLRRRRLGDALAGSAEKGPA